jgi:hypothetical protein
MQSTPYEVKRLEYQLRIDAANRCPGTEQMDHESTEVDAEPAPIEGQASLMQRVALAITAFVRGRPRAEAS